ncbi:MAG: DUF932 domain-containing protein, partial [archaeon]
ETLDNLEIVQDENNINTIFNDKLISTTNVSDKYQLFDFSSFAKQMVNQAENYFEPEKYSLRIRKGEQELRLIGEEVMINGEKYHKMFNLLNSTDKSKALQLNIGLIRFVCSNGLVIGKEGSYSHMKVKHFKSKLNPKIEEFEKDLEKFNVSIDYQSELIESLSKKKVSYLDLAKNYVYDDEGNIEKSKLLKLRSFGKKLLNSKTDSLENLTSEQVKLLNNPDNYLTSEQIDIEMPGSKVFNCYTELWRNYDSSVMYRESNRILELI